MGFYEKILAIVVLVLAHGAGTLLSSRHRCLAGGNACLDDRRSGS